MSKEIIQDFTSGSVFKKLIRFSMPLFLANLLQIVYSMVDMLVVGHVIGSAGLSAVTIGGEITNFFTMFVMGFCNAVSGFTPMPLGLVYYWTGKWKTRKYVIKDE